jgi:hypothetical protein
VREFLNSERADALATLAKGRKWSVVISCNRNNAPKSFSRNEDMT